MSEETSQQLKIALSAAVPLHIMEMKRLPWEEITRISHEASQYLAEHGDALMYRQKGITAKAFNHLARGVAALSFVPGGVTVFGLHFESRHEGGEMATGVNKPRNLTFEAGTLGRFILKHGLRIEWEQVDWNPSISHDPWARTATHYAVTLIDKDDRRLNIPYSMGPAHRRGPDVEDVLQDLARDAWDYEMSKGNLEEFIAVHGGDPEDADLQDLFQAMEAQTAGLRVFLGKEKYRELMKLAESSGLGASRRA